MSLNWKEIDKILEEIDLTGSYIQKIRQPSEKILILDIYKPAKKEKLLISLEQGKTRLHFASSPIKNKIKLQRFAQFLRSRINGGKIISCTQPGQQRIIKIKIISGEIRTLLWIRLWNSNPNIIVTDENGKILDALMRKPNKNEVSGKKYYPQLKNEKGKKGLILRNFSKNAALPYWENIENYYDKISFDEKLKQLKNKALLLLEKKSYKLENRINQLESNIQLAENSDLLKQKGDLLLSNSQKIKKGSANIEVENWFDHNNLLIIELDPKLTPQENSLQYYKKFQKFKSSLKYYKEELNNCKKNFEKTKKDKEWILQTDNLDQLEKWITETKPTHKEKELKQVTPGLQFKSSPFTILVGRTAKENDQLLRHYVRGNDSWLHTRDCPGGYVFIRSIKGKTIPLETLLDAGHLAIHYSKAKNNSSADLYITQVKYLRRAKNGPLGTVLPTHEKNLNIKIDLERLTQLLETKS